MNVPIKRMGFYINLIINLCLKYLYLEVIIIRSSFNKLREYFKVLIKNNDLYY